MDFSEEKYRGLAIKNGWRSVGPGGGGAQFFPSINPLDDKNIIVFCDMSGMYVTDDAGQNWISHGMHSIGKRATFDPTNENIVYMGSSGLFKSEDKGKTWEIIYPKRETITDEFCVGDEARHRFVSTSNWPGGSIQGIDLHHEDSKKIIIGVTQYAKHMYSTQRVVFCMSNDGGENFDVIDAEIEGEILRNLFVDQSSPLDSIRFFATTDRAAYVFEAPAFMPKKMKLPKEVSFISSATAGMSKENMSPVLYIVSQDIEGDEMSMMTVYRSDDCGQSFKKPDHSRLSVRQITNDGEHLSCCASDAAIAYMSVFRKADYNPSIKNYEGVVKTTDFGETWEWVLAITDKFPDNFEKGWLDINLGIGWPEPPLYITVSQTNPNRVFYTTLGSSVQTFDGGKTWLQAYSELRTDGAAVGHGLEVTTCYGVHFDPFHSQNIIITYTDIGLFRSTDGGIGWYQATKNIPKPWSGNCYDLCYDPDVKDKLWSAWSNTHDFPRVKMFRNNQFIKTNHAGGVAVSFDGAVNWQLTSTGLPEDSPSTCIVLDPNSPVGSRTLYLSNCGHGVYKSVDDGKTWKQMNHGLGNNLYTWKLLLLSDGTLYLLCMRAERDEKTVDGKMYQSTDGAENWIEVLMPKHNNAPNDLCFDPANPKRMYMTFWPKIDVQPAEGGGAYRTDDGGESWIKLPLQSQFTYGVTIDQKNPSTVFVVDFENSCYRTDDCGQTWKRIAGYGFKWGHKAFLDPHNEDMIYITTFGGSVWHGPANGNGLIHGDIVSL